MKQDTKTMDGYARNRVFLVLLGGVSGESHDEFRKRILEQTAPELAAQTGAPVKVVLTCEPAPSALFPFLSEKAALITCTGENRPKVATPWLRGIFTADQSIPRPHKELPPPGEDVSEVCMLTLFNKKKKISRELYFKRWFGHHTPYSLKHFPLIGYVRNVLLQEESEQPPLFDAAVEEFFKAPEDLIKPRLFFNTALRLPIRLIQLFFDVNSFLDMKNIETYFCRAFTITAEGEIK